MKKQKTEKELVGRINPFSRAWSAVKNSVRFNITTLLLTILVNIGLVLVVIVASVLTLASLFVILLNIPPVREFLHLFASYFQYEIPQLSFALIPAILLVAVLPLLLIALSSFMIALLQKVLLESMREKKVGFREVFKVALHKLPRLWLLALVAAGVNLLILAAITTLIVLIVGVFSSLENTAFMFFVTATAGIVALLVLLVIINLRWFLYSPLIILDSNQKVLPAIRASKAHFGQAPGYTVALLLISVAIASVFELFASMAEKPEGGQWLATFISLIGSIFFIGIMTLGYLDIKAAAAQETRLRAKKGMLALAILAFIIVAAISSSLQPDQPPTQSPFNWPEGGTPVGDDYELPIDQS